MIVVNCAPLMITALRRPSVCTGSLFWGRVGQTRRLGSTRTHTVTGVAAALAPNTDIVGAPGLARHMHHPPTLQRALKHMYAHHHQRGQRGIVVGIVHPHASLCHSAKYPPTGPSFKQVHTSHCTKTFHATCYYFHHHHHHHHPSRCSTPTLRRRASHQWHWSASLNTRASSISSTCHPGIRATRVRSGCTAFGRNSRPGQNTHEAAQSTLSVQWYRAERDIDISARTSILLRSCQQWLRALIGTNKLQS